MSTVLLLPGKGILSKAHDLNGWNFIACLFRLQLPESLPPSFRGSAVRYSYQLEAKAIFAAQSWAGTPMSTAPSTEFKKQLSLPPAPETPAQQSTQAHAAASSQGHPPVARHPSRSAVKPNAGQQQRRAPGAVQIKTPIHIWPAV